MHGLWAAIGPTARHRSPTWGVPGETQDAILDGARIERRSPVGQPLPDWQASSRSGRVRVFLDGEIAMRSLPAACGLRAHIAAFAETIESRGVNRALEGLQAGTFNAVVFDGAGRTFLLRDPLGTIPVYEAQAGPDWLVSTNPVSLARADGVDSTPDRIGLISWALVGYTIGTRHLVRGVRVVRPGVQRVREADGSLASRPLPFDFFAQVPPTSGGPSVEAIADAFLGACERLASSDLPTAHSQSGGMDSRLILAAWPGSRPITCYGYGDPCSGEVSIARDVAKLRGAPYHHVQPDGDQVSRLLDQVFEANGLMVFPERWFLADRIAADGHARVLDGFAGDILLGHHFYPSRPTFSGRISRILARYRDTRIDDIGMETVAKEVYSIICELPKPARLAGFLDADFVAELERSRKDVVAEVHDELVRLRPENDSLITLIHNFTVANRSAHATVQQGVMSRSKLAVGYPFASDSDFLRLVHSVPPSRSAFRRLQIEIFRKYFPNYAKLPYSGSMLPLGRSASAHQISDILLGRGIRIPGLTGRRTRSPNNWERWLRESNPLREKLGGALRAGGIAGPGLQGKLDELADGTTRGNGKLLHIASIGRWLELPPATTRDKHRRPLGGPSSLLSVEPLLAGATGSHQVPFGG